MSKHGPNPAPRCYGCNKPLAPIYLRVSSSGKVLESSDTPLIARGDTIEQGIGDDFDFCAACRAEIPDHASISSEARMTAAVEADAYGGY